MMLVSLLSMDLRTFLGKEMELGKVYSFMRLITITQSKDANMAQIAFCDNVVMT